MAASNSSKLPPDFVNPFANEDPDKVWENLRKTSRSVSRKEAFSILEKAAKIQKTTKRKKKA